MPEGVAPGTPANGEPVSSIRLPPLTEKPATVLCAASTTQSVEPSGERRASSAPAPAPFENGVEPIRDSEPSLPIEKREIVAAAVLTVNRYWPSWLISTQHGAV